MQLREAKQILRAALETASDEKLAEMLAWAQDGMMLYRNPCGCFLGSLGAERMHDGINMRWCNLLHYSVPRNRFPLAEKAYCILGISRDDRDDLRQRRIVPIIKAQMRIRELHRKDAREFTATKLAQKGSEYPEGSLLRQCKAGCGKWVPYGARFHFEECEKQTAETR